MNRLAQDFPPGVAYSVVYNPTEFIRSSVEAVIVTLVEAVILVALVVILFLQTWRAAIIPILAIPVSLVGTFTVMAAVGISFNTLSLFGLVLAIGIVVDDAIVVVENVERHLREGLSPREAARKTMDEVGFALIAIALVLIAVFLPTAFITGLQGSFYKQFAITIAASTAISAHRVAHPVARLGGPAAQAAQCRASRRRGILYRLGAPVRGFFKGFNWLSSVFPRAMAYMTARLVRFGLIMILVYAGLLFVTYRYLVTTPTGLVPQLDRGYFIAVFTLPPGSTLDRTDAVIRKASDIITSRPGVKDAVAFVGLDGATFTNAPNAGVIFITPAALRGSQEGGREQGRHSRRAPAADVRSQRSLRLRDRAAIGAGHRHGRRPEGLCAGPRRTRTSRAGRRGLGHCRHRDADAGLHPGLHPVQHAHAADLRRYRPHQGRAARRADQPRIRGAVRLYGLRLRQRLQHPRPHLPGDGAGRQSLSALLARRGQPQDPQRSSGDMVPIGSVATFSDTTGPYRVPRYNLYPAAEVQVALAPGFSSGQGIAAIEKLAAEKLPSGFGFEWTEIALQEKLAGSTAFIAFGLGVLFVFLLLSALYESWLLPLAVILIVPMCILAAMIGVTFRGLDRNVLVEIGLVVLVGLAAKNAILIVEFAKQAQEHGMSRFDAAVEAARTRLRPIVMTSLAFILGVVPLVFASGAGAEMRQSLGTAVFAGHDRRDAVRPDLYADLLCAFAQRHCERRTARRHRTPAGLWPVSGCDAVPASEPSG